MGYAVYNDGDRWAGYGVPAECDVVLCSTKIDRGSGFKCETYTEYKYERNGVEIPEPDHDQWLAEDIVEIDVEVEGCGLFFCPEHGDHDAHSISRRKPDSIEWLHHMLTDDSWQQWRDENPNRLAEMESRITREERIEAAIGQLDSSDREEARRALRVPDFYPARNVADYLGIRISDVWAWRRVRGFKKARS